LTGIWEAELLFQAGVLVTPVIKKYASDEGWIVTLAGKYKLNPMLETARTGAEFYRLTLCSELPANFVKSSIVIIYNWKPENHRASSP